VSMFTRAWGPTTPALDNGLEVVLRPFPAAAPNVELQGTVTEVRQGSAGGTPIPADGAVITAQGPTGQRLLEEAPLGTVVNIRLVLSPEWGDVPEALGGGPALVRAGKPIFRHGELFTPEQLARNPRTAVGQLRDGRILFVVVDGRRPGYSAGMTSFELAQTLVRLGAVTGSGLDSGGSSTMAFDGELLNRPSDPGGERAVSEGLFVHYAGVFAAAPTEPVLSPNGDGIADAQDFAYKLVRPSRTTVTLLGPGRARRQIDSGDKQPGTYRFSWNGLNAARRPEPEGSWRLTVQATDDEGRASVAHRFFSLNRTLGALRVPATVRVNRRGGRATAQFTLTRAARVTVTVQTAAGAVVATPARRSLGAGRHAIVWNGRVGRGSLAHSGRYVVRVTAANSVGTATLTSALAVRRVAGAR
jgi:flagellar hook assembly protein FlgD